ncbi:hypothetical protein CRENBAI_000290 [Crenichthys baileyi]|uniref:Uncharacterized protein n=1 Tax=Crenichthys baileyi TaxID=28760 RepID=A0AAV9RH58_9TELE
MHSFTQLASLIYSHVCPPQCSLQKADGKKEEHLYAHTFIPLGHHGDLEWGTPPSWKLSRKGGINVHSGIHISYQSLLCVVQSLSLLMAEPRPSNSILLFPVAAQMLPTAPHSGLKLDSHSYLYESHHKGLTKMQTTKVRPQRYK